MPVRGSVRICAIHYDEPMHLYNSCAKCAEAAAAPGAMKPALPFWELSAEQYQACKDAARNPDGSEDRGRLYLLLCQRYTLQHP